MQILDYGAGHLMAFAASAALRRQQIEGGSWHVRISLAQVGHWLRGLGRVDNGFAVSVPDRTPYIKTSPSGFGELAGFTHSARLSSTPTKWVRPSVPPGTHPAIWP
jgi:hypothetical protein